MKTAISLGALAALALSLPAQETTAVATSSPLVFKTSSPELAQGMLARFGDGGGSLEDGQMVVMTIDDGGRPQVKVEQGDAGLIHIQAQPARLMEVYADKVNEYRQMAQGMGTFMLSQQGLQPKDAIAIIQGLFDFPTQIASASLVVSGDPSAPEDGFSGSLALTAKDATWFGRFIDTMRPHATGAPALQQAGAMLSAALAVDVKDLDVLMPLFTVFAAQGSKNKEDKAKHLEYMETAFKSGDGTFAITWNPASGGMQVIGGLADPEAVKKMWDDPGYQKWTEEQSKTNPAVEIEADFNAFDHRGVRVARTTMIMDEGMPNPMFKDGRAETYMGIADKYMVLSMFGSGDDGIKQLIDTALDGKVARKALGADVLGTLSIKVAELADHMSDGMADSEEMPEKINVVLGRKGNSLTVKFDAK